MKTPLERISRFLALVLSLATVGLFFTFWLAFAAFQFNLIEIWWFGPIMILTVIAEGITGFTAIAALEVWTEERRKKQTMPTIR